jgi:uncharacterized membrane protein YGL010W
MDRDWERFRGRYREHRQAVVEALVWGLILAPLFIGLRELLRNMVEQGLGG